MAAVECSRITSTVIPWEGLKPNPSNLTLGVSLTSALTPRASSSVIAIPFHDSHKHLSSAVQIIDDSFSVLRRNDGEDKDLRRDPLVFESILDPVDTPL